MSYESGLKYYIEERKLIWGWQTREEDLAYMEANYPEVKYSDAEHALMIAENLPWRFRKCSYKAIRYCFVLMKMLGLSKEQTESSFGDFTHSNNEEMTMIISDMEKEAGVTLSEYKAENNDLAWTRRYGFNHIGEGLALCFDCRHCTIDKKDKTGRCNKNTKVMIQSNHKYPYFESCFESRYGKLQK